MKENSRKKIRNQTMLKIIVKQLDKLKLILSSKKEDLNFKNKMN
jgi:hypothetical protein